MKTLEEIKLAISQLSEEELTSFRLWFASFDAAIWDKQFEADVAAGKLDRLAKKALQHLIKRGFTHL
ncbi:hypothetical protein DSM106972_004010 [Dulcicalothrix desertica PCC 7102]|uniref:Uncharacterized protein n=1 Tax=Dulcicalothrix desertica PCC 7102 TaxID=232991 RepID=A0A3S1CLC8_9CYAN|nr:hypothetical protein [Dulcicalothrix desertica]RUT09906.1 hypothetical protein DSM106972_004010 [Dulcicalothrix desertica PCC 7102]TWH51097.1 hypothetical protein CAL7102_05471 [Dulcicalothrix desertica PCC 7102]